MRNLGLKFIKILLRLCLRLNTPPQTFLLDMIQSLVQALLFHQLFMGSSFHQFPLLQYKDLISVRHCAQPVCEHNHRFPFNQLCNRFLNENFIFRIQGGCGLIYKIG